MSDFNANNSALIVIDFQGRLAVSVQNAEAVQDRLNVLIPAARQLDVPVIWVEHVPEKLGPTHPAVAQCMEGLTPIAKYTFNACLNEDFLEALDYVAAKNLIIVGVEAHVCILQTSEALLARGKKVQLVADAISSRNEMDRNIAIERLIHAGAKLTTTETLLFELLETPRHPKFRDVLSLLK